MDTKNPTPWVFLPQIPGEIKELTAAEPARVPRYRSVYGKVLDGQIAAELVNGRYRVRRSQLPEIAEMFGLSVATSNRAA